MRKYKDIIVKSTISIFFLFLFAFTASFFIDTQTDAQQCIPMEKWSDVIEISNLHDQQTGGDYTFNITSAQMGITLHGPADTLCFVQGVRVNRLDDDQSGGCVVYYNSGWKLHTYATGSADVTCRIQCINF